jgi:hypothetical protein
VTQLASVRSSPFLCPREGPARNWRAVFSVLLSALRSPRLETVRFATGVAVASRQHGAARTLGVRR